MWGLLISNFGKKFYRKLFTKKFYVFLLYTSVERIKKIVAKAKVMIPFFMHLHIVNKRDVRNVRKTLKVEKRPSC